MKHIFNKYKVQLIKEEGKLYECNNYILCPNDIKDVVINILNINKECEEVVCIIALDTKNKILGTFEVSRGSVNASILNTREIFKRLCLINASSFVCVHNHPSGDCNPSNEDIVASKKLIDASKIMDINLIDFAIMGNKLYSFKQYNLL